MGAKLRILVLVLVTVCLQVPAGASLRVCLCGPETPAAATSCCAPVSESTSCCARDAGPHEVQLAVERSCHGTDQCACHVVCAPERDDANTLRPGLPGVERVLATWVAAVFVISARPAQHDPVPAPRATDPPGRRRNLPLRI